MTRFSVGLAISLVALPAWAETITVRGTECQRLVQHASTNSATYTPGVDVRGKAVAPADLDGGSNIAMPDSIDIQIGVDLADRLGRRDAKKGITSTQPNQGQNTAVRKVTPFEGKVPLGTISVKGQDVFWNGERMLPQDQVLLTEACRLSMTTPGGNKIPPSKPE